ncbi:uncharacterized protein LOC134235666 [Saccostrea cucullata]|uniref:uncharacterized protein LOC134235666 n=1 Tax=Saccostrea cuccullata TaxID=36930 RepID=UPI002ED48F73
MTMFRVSHISVSRRQQWSSTHHTFFGTVQPRGKQPCFRGLFLGVIAGILLTIGIMLTWIAGLSGIVEAGPILIGFSLIVFLVASCQFLQARKEQLLERQAEEQRRQAIATMAVNQDGDNPPETVIIEALTPSEMYSSTDDNAPPSYMEATESDLNHSVLLPEEVNEQIEDPPSYAEAMSTSCVEICTRGTTPASVCWIPPYYPHLSPPEHCYSSLSGPPIMMTSLDGEEVEDAERPVILTSLDREGTENNESPIIMTSLHPYRVENNEPPIIITSSHREGLRDNDLEISSDVDEFSDTSSSRRPSEEVQN